MTFPDDIPIPEPVVTILRRLENAGHETWCVGGAIRDTLLGDPQADVDLATAATPEQVQRLFPRTVPVGIAHGTVGVLDEHGVLHEVTTFRRDVHTDGRHAVVAFGVSLEDDLARRDLTINAIAWHPLRREWMDPFGGRADLTAGVIRAVGDPAARFREDRLRILRALRFAARFRFTIAPDTWAAAVAQSAETGHLSAERVRDEWWKGIRSAADPAELMRWWGEAGVAMVWLCPPTNVAPQAASDAVGSDDRDPLLHLAWWCRPVEPVLRRLKCSSAEIARGHAIDRHPAAPADADPVSVRRWLATVGPAADDLATLARWRGGDQGWREVMRAVIGRGDPIARAGLAISGDDLVREGVVAPGPGMGRLLDHLLNAVLEDPTRNTRDQLLALARATQ